ncbi:DUF1285 domain-containing protein [Salinarimonas rosea]|uniref:DUF1285 domain-containing protein n=1 Tax=Salinarimonas rosea TaxID=552063 RepID=UPI000413ED3D|nr:DUF1285 domain-containing protein [Salinarimonas rosea]
MADHEFETGGPDALSRLVAAAKGGRGAPPVERWNPPYCGEIDMRIAADGTWFYQGTPIGRPALVKLFASVLRKDPERFVLVTPVERVGIVVEDAPFLAVEMAVEGAGEARRLAFRTNVDDVVTVGADHPLVFARDGHGGAKPYVKVRGELWALVTRALAYDLAEMAEPRTLDGRDVFGIAAGGGFWEVMDAADAG